MLEDLLKLVDNCYDTEVSDYIRYSDRMFIDYIIAYLERYDIEVNLEDDFIIPDVKPFVTVGNQVHYFKGGDVIVFDAERDESEKITQMNCNTYKNAELKRCEVIRRNREEHFTAEFDGFEIEIAHDIFEDDLNRVKAIRYLLKY